MKKLIVTTLLIAFSATACAQSTPVPNPTADVNAIYTQAAMTLFAEATQSVPATPEPTLLLPPTEALQETQNGSIFSWNYLAEQTSGGMTIQVARVLIANKEAAEKEFGYDFDQAEILVDKTVVIEIIYKVTNNAGEAIAIYPDQATVIVGSEQVDLSEYMLSGTRVGENIGGDIYPGVTAIGGVWFGVKRSPLDDINNITIIISPPVASDDWQALGEEFKFDLDLSTRGFAPMPDELK